MPSKGGLIIQPAWLISESSNEPKQNWGVRVYDGKIQSVAPPKNLISNTKIATKAALISEEIKDEGLRTALSTFGENILKSEKRL